MKNRPITVRPAEEDEDVSPKPKGMSTALVMTLLVGLPLFLGTAAIVAVLVVRARFNASSVANNTIDAGQEFMVGDLGVRVSIPKKRQLLSTDVIGRPKVSGDWYVHFVLDTSNYGQGKIIRAYGQSGKAKLVDQFGNQYTPVYPGSLMDFTDRVHDQTTPGTYNEIYPGRMMKDILIFKLPVAGVDTAILELDNNCYGGLGKTFVKVPVADIPRD